MSLNPLKLPCKTLKMFDSFKPYLVLSILLHLLNTVPLCGQQLTRNDSFEGSEGAGGQQGNPPSDWYNLGLTDSSGDTQPGVFGVTQTASHGNKYLSLVTRQLSPPGTVETCWSKLLQPLEQDQCYSLLIDLSLSNEFKATHAWTDYYFDAPCKFQILGGNDLLPYNTDAEVLWESPTLDHYDWKTYHARIGPLSKSFKYLLLRPMFADSNVFTNSVVLVDNLRLQPETNHIHNTDQYIWVPDSMQNIVWHIDGNLVPDSNQNQLDINQPGTYQVTFTDPRGCGYTATKNIKLNLNPIKLYPNPTYSSVWIESVSAKNGTFEVAIFNAIGQLIDTEIIPVDTGYNTFELDFSNKSNGMYVIRIKRMEVGWNEFKVIRTSGLL